MSAYIRNGKKRVTSNFNPKKKKKRSNGEAIVKSFKYLTNTLIARGSEDPAPIELYLQFTKAAKIFEKDQEYKVYLIISVYTLRKQKDSKADVYYFVIISQNIK